MLLLFIPFRYLDKKINTRLLLKKPFNEITASKVSAPFSTAEQVHDVLDIFSQILSLQFDPKIFHVFLYDQENEQYLPQISVERKVTTDLRFASSNGVVNILLNSTQPVFIEEKQFQELSTLEKEQLRLLGADILIPFHGKFGLLGWAAIGPVKIEFPSHLRTAK